MSEFFKRTIYDRRGTFDRRQAHDILYFERGGGERRSGHEKRDPSEQRSDWVRIAQWKSIPKPPFQTEHGFSL